MEETEAEEISFIAVGLMIIVANLVEITCIVRKRNKTTFEKLLLSLALSDLLFGTIITVYKTLDFALGRKPWLDERVTTIVFLLSSVFSLLNLLAITIDRFLAIRFPIKHRILVTPRRTNVLIISIWASTSLVGVGSNLILVLRVPAGEKYAITTSAIGILSIGTIINAIYFCIIRYLLTREVIATARPEDGKILQRIRELFRGPQKVERAVLLSSVIVSVTFIICTFPFAIEYLILGDGEELSFGSKMLIILNSLLNPFVYFFNNFLRKSCTKRE